MTSENDDPLGVPAFGRIEIALGDRGAIATVAAELRALALKLDRINRETDDDAITCLLAYRAIRSTSTKLRGK